MPMKWDDLKAKTYQLQVSWHSLWKLMSDRESEFQDLYEKNGKDLKSDQEYTAEWQNLACGAVYFNIGKKI